MGGVASEVRVFDWKDAPPKGDAADHPAVNGGSREAVEDLIEAWAKIPLWESGEASLSPSPIKGEGQGHQVEGSLKVVRFAEMGEPKDRRYLIDELFPEAYPGVVFGDGGVAKSFLMLSAGMCVAADAGTWLGLKVAGGPVLYADFELDQDEQNRRAIRLAKGMGLAKPPDGLFYLSALGHQSSEAFRVALEACKEHSVKLMLLDSLGPALEGDPLIAKDIIGFYRRLEHFRAAGVTVMIVDHQAKLQAGERYDSKRAFGSVYKGNLARSVVQIEAKDRDEGTLTVGLRQIKHNFGPVASPFGAKFTFDEDSVTVEPVELDAVVFAKEGTPNAEDLVTLELAKGSAFPEDIAARTPLTLKTVKNTLSRLRKAGVVVDTGRTKGQAREVSLVSSPFKDGDGDTEQDAQDARQDGSEVTCIHGFPGGGVGCYLCDPAHPSRREDR